MLQKIYLTFFVEGMFWINFGVGQQQRICRTAFQIFSCGLKSVLNRTLFIIIIIIMLYFRYFAASLSFSFSLFPHRLEKFLVLLSVHSNFGAIPQKVPHSKIRTHARSFGSRGHNQNNGWRRSNLTQQKQSVPMPNK